MSELTLLYALCFANATILLAIDRRGAIRQWIRRRF